MSELLLLEQVATEPAPPRRVRSVSRVALRKLIDIAVVIFAAGTLTFVMLQLMPGDPVDTLLRGIYPVTDEVRAEVIADFGLDRPVWLQYIQYIGGLAVGDFGQSYQMRQPVLEIIADNFPYTAALAGAALFLAIVLSTTGSLIAAGRGPFASLAAQTLELLAISIPSFWIGLLLLTAFSFAIPIFPSSGATGFISLVLPAVTLAIPLTGVLSQVLRERLDEALEQPFVTTVRSRGAGPLRVRLLHVLRHAVIPALTVSGAILGSLLAGAAVIETLFARPGLGRVLLNAVVANDVPIIMGVIVFGAIVFVIVNSVVDVAAAAIDPRMRLGGGEA